MQGIRGTHGAVEKYTVAVGADECGTQELKEKLAEENKKKCAEIAGTISIFKVLASGTLEPFTQGRRGGAKGSSVLYFSFAFFHETRYRCRVSLYMTWASITYKPSQQPISCTQSIRG